MNSTLIIGLGNTLMGDEGIGSYIAEALALDPRLPSHAKVIQGGTDLLRLADKMEGYDRIILVDAMLDPVNSGRLEIIEEDFSRFKDQQDGAHHLSVIQAVALMRLSNPALSQTHITLALVGINSVKRTGSLSPALQIKLRELANEIMGLFAQEVFE
jgi:hydrogenase maturation protease